MGTDPAGLHGSLSRSFFFLDPPLTSHAKLRSLLSAQVPFRPELEHACILHPFMSRKKGITGACSMCYCIIIPDSTYFISITDQRQDRRACVCLYAAVVQGLMHSPGDQKAPCQISHSDAIFFFGPTSMWVNAATHSINGYLGFLQGNKASEDRRWHLYFK